MDTIHQEVVDEIDRLVKMYGLSKEDEAYCTSQAIAISEGHPYLFAHNFHLCVIDRFSGRIRRAAKKHGMSATKKQGRWYFSDERKMLCSPERGLSLVDAAKFFEEQVTA